MRLNDIDILQQKLSELDTKLIGVKIDDGIVCDIDINISINLNNTKLNYVRLMMNMLNNFMIFLIMMIMTKNILKH